MEDVHDRGIRVMVSIAGTKTDEETGLGYATIRAFDPIQLWVPRTLEELGMPLLHADTTPEILSSQTSRTYTSDDWFVDCSPGYINETCSGNTAVPVDYWLIDSRSYRLVEDPSFTLLFPDKAMLAGQVWQYPRNDGALSYVLIESILSELTTRLSNATRQHEPTECVAADPKSPEHIVRGGGLNGSDYICYNFDLIQDEYLKCPDVALTDATAAAQTTENPCSGVMCDGDGDGPCYCDPCPQCPYVPPEDPVTIYELASSAEDFSTLASLIDVAGLAEALSGDGPFTVFAPTNNAFAKLPQELVDFLLLPENVDELGKILKHHVVAANVTSESIQSGPVETLNGESVDVQAFSTGIRVDDANVVEPYDIAATNGVVHAIDSVLVPPNVALPSYTSPPTETPVKEEEDEEDAQVPANSTAAIESTESAATFKSSGVKVSAVLCFLGMLMA